MFVMNQCDILNLVEEFLYYQESFYLTFSAANQTLFLIK